MVALQGSLLWLELLLVGVWQAPLVMFQEGLLLGLIKHLKSTLKIKMCHRGRVLRFAFGTDIGVRGSRDRHRRC